MVERRQQPRVEDDLGIAINLMSEQGPVPHRTSTIFHLTKDISRSGLRFENDRELPVNALLKVHVALKIPLLTITHFARVRWSQKTPSQGGYDIGVHFSDSPPNDMQIWSNYVAQRLGAVG
jgi:hypothetical protein